MNTLTSTITTVLAIGTIVSQIAVLIIAILFLSYWLKKKRNRPAPTHPLIQLWGEWAIPVALIAAILAVSGSLFYSEIAGFEPCKFCWFQRIFVYPQVFLLGLALIKRERRISDYILALAIPGAIISAYHYYIQLGGSALIPCSAIGYSAHCSQRFFMEFGYITIPLMCLTTGLLIIASMIANKITQRDR